jgi:thiamine-phosphate pyrophosphorylase
LERARVRIVSRLSDPHRRPLLCYVTDRLALSLVSFAEARKALLQRIEDASAAGVDWVQIREKDLSGRECGLLVREALQRAADSVATKARARIFVNDRLDVALAQHSDGVHLGEKSLPPQEAKRLVTFLHRENDFLIGISCHSLEAAQAAERGGANYLFFGPVFATPSKAPYGPPQGLDRLAEVCRAVSLPVLAIGGITLENCASCLSAGAAGIAAIRLFQEAPDISALVKKLKKLTTA